MFITLATFALGRRLSMMAKSAPMYLAAARALTTPPTSGDTMIKLSYFCALTSSSNNGVP